MNIEVRTRLEPLTRASVILLCILFFSFSATAQTCRISGPTSVDGVVAAAQRGDAGAALRVAKAFYNGGVRAEQSYYDAFKWFEAAANSGSVEAKAWLGSCYLFGFGTRPDLNRGKDLIESAANEGNPVGTRFLGMMYRRGVGVPRDYAKAISLLTKAAEQGDGYSYNALGEIYQHGFTVERNREAAKSMFEKGAALGDGWALLHLGEIYATGEPSTRRNKDYAKALELYSAAMRAGNPIAPFRIGKLYESGKFGNPERSKIFACYQQSAIRGFPIAQLAVGKAYEHGIGTEVNSVEAYVWYSLSSERSNREAFNLRDSLIDRLSYNQMTEARALLVKRRKMTGRIMRWSGIDCAAHARGGSERRRRSIAATARTKHSSLSQVNVLKSLQSPPQDLELKRLLCATSPELSIEHGE